MPLPQIAQIKNKWTQMKPFPTTDYTSFHRLKEEMPFPFHSLFTVKGNGRTQAAPTICSLFTIPLSPFLRPPVSQSFFLRFSVSLFLVSSFFYNFTINKQFT